VSPSPCFPSLCVSGPFFCHVLSCPDFCYCPSLPARPPKETETQRKIDGDKDEPVSLPSLLPCHLPLPSPCIPPAPAPAVHGCCVFWRGSKYVSPFFRCYLGILLIYFRFHALFQDHLQQYLFQQVLVYHWPSMFTLWEINQMERAVCPLTWSGSSTSIPQCCAISNITFHIQFQAPQLPLSYTLPHSSSLKLRRH